MPSSPPVRANWAITCLRIVVITPCDESIYPGAADADSFRDDGEILSSDEIEGRLGGGGGGDGGGASAGYSYTPPPGGGGVSSTIQVGDTTVTFGHGGRHMRFADISGLENAIAQEVVTLPPALGRSVPMNIIYSGTRFTYRYRTLGDNLINVGTYFYAMD